jgi:hypothetical protein
VENRATLFLEVMAAIAVIGVMAFLVGLLARIVRSQEAPTAIAGPGGRSPYRYEFILALPLLIVAVGLLLWMIATGRQWIWGETVIDWQTDTRTILFAAAMVGLVALGLIAWIAYTVLEATQRETPYRAVEAPRALEASPVRATVATSSGARIFGPLALAVAVLLLCWIGLGRAEQRALMAEFIYPASLGVALVLLFDKAIRGASTKTRAEVLREWLLCDTLVFLLCLGFLNVRSLEKPEGYAGSFWDMLAIVLFFASFWLVDRKTTRFRFLVAYGFLVVLPLLLLMWRTAAGVAAPGGATWWGSVWPFFVLAAIFFVIEILMLLGNSPEQQMIPTVKDAIFVVLYAILLLIAVGAGARA